MNKIIIVGSINMDYSIYVDEFPSPGETIIGKSKYIQPGGKGANQAVAASNSKQTETHFIASIGNDNDGKQIEEILLNHGVVTHLKHCDTLTGNATIMINSSSENEITIISGANAELMPNDIDTSIFRDSKFVILQNEIPAETNEFVLKLAKKENVKVVYNPAPYRKFENSLFEYIDTFIVNEVELSQYTNENDIERSIDSLLKLGVKNIIVTLGKDGSIYINKDVRIKIDANKVKPVDTVAAGDTYVGYFVASLAHGYSIEESLKYASKASSITVSKKGSIVSIPQGEEVYEK